MKYFAYIITTFLLRLLASMPKRIIYLNSDILYILLYHISQYRLKVVKRNLQSSFPEFSNKELKKTIKKFYRHLADVIIENGVAQFYSRKKLEKMFRFTNPEILHDYYRQGRDIILMTGHYNNWEWTVPLSYTFRYLSVIVYKPLRNKYFDKEISNSRTKFGAVVVPMGSIGRALFQYKEKEVLTLTGMAGDQKPSIRTVQHWTDFLHQKTAVFTGSEKLARKFNSVVVFLKVRRSKRGVYHGEIELITDDPKNSKSHEITDKYMRILEDLIKEEPANWLWSHRRWKYSYEEWLKKTGK